MPILLCRCLEALWHAVAIIVSTETSGGNFARRELGAHSMPRDSYFAELLVGGQIASVLVDSEVTYIMLTNGTQITIRGVVLVQPGQQNATPPVSAPV